MTAIGLCAVLGSAALADSSERPSGPTNDLIRLSQSWWGTPIEEFPKKAGLQPGEYSVSDHPSRSGVKVVVVTPQAAARWEPKELPAFEFDFSPAVGLQEISGFYKGTQKDVLAALTSRYGKHNREVEVLGMRAYGWEFDKSYLDLTYSNYNLIPKRQSLR